MYETGVQHPCCAPVLRSGPDGVPACVFRTDWQFLGSSLYQYSDITRPDGMTKACPHPSDKKLFDKLQFEAGPQNTQRGAKRSALPSRSARGPPAGKKCAISVRDSRFAGYTAARARQNPSWRAPPSHVFQQKSEVRSEMAQFFLEAGGGGAVPSRQTAIYRRVFRACPLRLRSSSMHYVSVILRPVLDRNVAHRCKERAVCHPRWSPMARAGRYRTMGCGFCQARGLWMCVAVA